MHALLLSRCTTRPCPQQGMAQVENAQAAVTCGHATTLPCRGRLKAIWYNAVGQERAAAWQAGDTWPHVALTDDLVGS